MGRDMTSPEVLVPKYRTMIYSALFDIHYWFFTDYDSCIYYTQQWIDSAPDSTSRAIAYVEHGISYSNKGDNIKALESYNIAQGYLQSPNPDLWTLAHLNNNLGMLYSQERELKRAEGYFLKAVDYAQASKVPG